MAQSTIPDVACFSLNAACPDKAQPKMELSFNRFTIPNAVDVLPQPALPVITITLLSTIDFIAFICSSVKANPCSN